MNFHLEEGAVLKFSTDQSLYFPAVLTRWEGIDCYNAHPLIYAYGESNIAITGKGIIDGQGSMETWWPMCGAVKYGWKEGMVAQRNGGRERLLMYGETSTPVYKRLMKPEDGMRPQLLNLHSCHTILIEGVTLLNSPFWVIHPLFCESLIVSGVTVFNRGPNGDGCDPESCKNVLIENCTFDTGDDCIAIKSGRNEDGRKWNIPSENIIVRGCMMRNGHGGVVIGSEISGGYRNLFVEDCRMDSPNLDRVIRIKTSTCRGGLIENVYVRNVTVGQCREAVLRINLQYENREKCKRGFDPIVRNVHLKNVTCEKSKLGVLIIGLEDDKHVYNISVEDSHFNNVAKGVNDIKGAKDVTFKNLYINGELGHNCSNLEYPNMNEKEDLEELQCFVSNIQNDWKTAYDAQIYITSLSVISNHDWNKLELWINLHQDGFIYKLRHYYPALSEDDIHIILLLRIDFNNAQISELFHVLESSFRIRRSRLKKKMNVVCESITDFVKSLYLE